MISTQRVTVSLPDYLYQQLQTYAGKRQVSRFVTEAVEAKILDKKIPTDPIEDFINLKKSLQLPQLTWRQIKAAINKGRM
ncbi:MAG: hypothetical protein HY381_00935 [Candidatus Chisholmbacteria bacterium]|nr:hypothetical protein [Candidatus Chisholmbacteria bacterium]